MKRTIAAITLAVCLIGSTLGSAYASEGTTTADKTAAGAASTSASSTGSAIQAKNTTALDENAIKDSAGILPSSPFYGIERAIEQLQIAITKSQEKLAALKAQFANERAAEAVIMADNGKEELAGKATAEYIKTLASAVNHINKAIEAKDGAVKTLDTLNKSYTNSQELLKSLLQNASASTKKVIEAALTEQDKDVSAINDFYTAKKAFSYAKDQFEQAQQELKAVKKNGNPDAIKLAEEKVKTAEAVKDELEAIKNSAEQAKKEVKNLDEQAQKLVKSGNHQVEKANKVMDKITEDENKDENGNEDNNKKIEKTKKEDKENLKEAKKEAQKIAKEAREHAKEISKNAKEEAKKMAENARKQTKDDSSDNED